MADDLQAVIDRVRRATRNLDMIRVCDELQQRLVAPVAGKPKLTRAQIQKNYRQRKKGNGK